MWHIHSVEYYATAKEIIIRKSSGQWMEPEIIFLNEVTRFKEANAACSLSSGTLNFKPSDVSI